MQCQLTLKPLRIESTAPLVGFDYGHKEHVIDQITVGNIEYFSYIGFNKEKHKVWHCGTRNIISSRIIWIKASKHIQVAFFRAKASTHTYDYFWMIPIKACNHQPKVEEEKFEDESFSTMLITTMTSTSISFNKSSVTIFFFFCSVKKITRKALEFGTTKPKQNKTELQKQHVKKTIIHLLKQQHLKPKHYT